LPHQTSGYRVWVKGRVECAVMEIHAPHHSTLTFKEALVHLCIVTTGILIALSPEGTLQWWHHRELVQETRERLEAEIRGTQASIQTVLKSLDPAKAKFIHAIDVASDLSAPGKRRRPVVRLFQHGSPHDGPSYWRLRADGIRRRLQVCEHV
jgi:hypothetical protein